MNLSQLMHMSARISNFILSDAETEVWTFEDGNSKTISPILPPGEFVSGIGLFAVDINYCST